MKIGLIRNWLMAEKFNERNFSISIPEQIHILRQEERTMAAKKKAVKKAAKKKATKKKTKK